MKVIRQRKRGYRKSPNVLHTLVCTHTQVQTPARTPSQNRHTPYTHHSIFKMSTKIYNVLFAVLYQAIFIAIRGCMQPLARGSLSRVMSF